MTAGADKTRAALDAVKAAGLAAAVDLRVVVCPIVGCGYQALMDANGARDRALAFDPAFAEYCAVAVNIAQPMEAVVRAASRRLWWQLDTALGEDADGNESSQQPEVCRGCEARRPDGFKGPYAPSHRDGLMSECPMLELDIELDAFNAAAHGGIF